MLGLRDFQKLAGNVRRKNAFEGKALTPGEDGGRNLVQLGGGQNKHQMLRRLLQNFQQRIEGRGRQGVHLVDDIHPLFQHGRRIHRLLAQGADAVHAAVAGGIQLGNIQKPPLINAAAGLTAIAGSAVLRIKAVDGLGQNPGAGGFAGAAGAGEKIGMARSPLRHLTLESFGDMGLTHHLRKGGRPPFAVQGLIHGHASGKNIE